VLIGTNETTAALPLDIERVGLLADMRANGFADGAE
jgi:hypothetical protein